MPSSRHQPGKGRGDERPVLVHAKAHQFLDLNQPFVYRTITSLEPFYRNVVAARARANESVFPWTEFEPFHRLENLRIPDPVGLAYRLVSRYGAPVAAVGHFGSGGACFLRSAQALDVPLVTIFGGVNLAEHCVQRSDERPAYEALFSHGTLFLCVSRSLRRLAIERGCAPGRIFVWHRGVDLDAMPRPGAGPGRADGRLRVLMVGRCHEKKGHVFGLRAFAKLLREAPTAELRIIGVLGTIGAEEGNVRALMRELGIADSVTLTGVVADDEVVREMCEADIALHPSITASTGDIEGVPNVLIEAHACGLPVVASRHSGIPEVVLDGESGFLAEEKDVDALAAGLRTLAADPGLRRRFGARGREHVGREFEIRRQGRRLAAHIEHARALHRQRQMPLTLGIPPLPPPFRDSAKSTVVFKLSLPADRDGLWARYAGSHRRYIGKAVRLWKRLDYPLILRPAFAAIADLVGQLKRTTPERMEEMPAERESLLRQTMALARRVAQLEQLQSHPGVPEDAGGARAGIMMTLMACGDCPHCAPDALWPHEACPLDARCLEVLEGEVALDGPRVAVNGDPTEGRRERLAAWLREAGPKALAVSDEGADRLPPGVAATTSQFCSGRLDVEEGSFDAVGAALSGVRRSVLAARIGELGRAVRPGGRIALWVAPFGVTSCAAQALGMPDYPPFAHLLFAKETLAGACGVETDAADLATAASLKVAVGEGGLNMVSWEPFHDPALPVTWIARMRPAIAGCDFQDVMTLGVFCILDRPARCAEARAPAGRQG